MQERLNAITHGVGAMLALVGLAVLTFAAAIHGTVWHVVSFAVFGAGLVLLYGVSAVYHSLPRGAAKSAFQRLDHAAIFLLIAASYTPFTLVVLHGAFGWAAFGVIWGLAVLGILCESMFGHRLEVLELSLIHI